LAKRGQGRIANFSTLIVSVSQIKVFRLEFDCKGTTKNSLNANTTQFLTQGPQVINFVSNFRKKLVSGEICLGAGITLNDPIVVEALAPLVDFFWIDMEHNPIGIETMVGYLIAARAGGVPAFVRVPDSSTAFIKRVLDSGAEGVIVPQVCTAIEAQQVIDACRYKPLGNRGWGPRRPSQYGFRGVQQVLTEAREQLFVAVQIENSQALNEVEEIAKIKGIDSLVVGPFDLSASLGYLGQLDHPEVESAIKHIIKVAHEAGLAVGFGDEANAESVNRWVTMGADWVQAGGDVSYMIQSAVRLFEEIRRSREKGS